LTLPLRISEEAAAEMAEAARWYEQNLCVSDVQGTEEL
jgi:hypothetical protein